MPIADRSRPRVGFRLAARPARSSALAIRRDRPSAVVHSRRYPRGPMVPGPVITPGMRTTAFLSAAGEGDCCAATGAPPTTDVMTHTPVTTSTLLIKFIICTHPHPNGSPEHYQLASHPSTDIDR